MMALQVILFSLFTWYNVPNLLTLSSCLCCLTHSGPIFLPSGMYINVHSTLSSSPEIYGPTLINFHMFSVISQNPKTAC